MTAYPSRAQHLTYVATAETVWGEDDTSMSGAKAIPHSSPIDLTGVARSMIESNRATQYKNEQHRGTPGPYADASFSFDLDLLGHESATTGAVSLTDHETLVGYVVGAVAAGGAGTTASGTGTTTTITTTSSGTFSAGQMGRAGALADARGGGHWFATTSHVTTTLTTKLAMAAATINTDVVYGAATVSTLEGVTQASQNMTSRKFLAQTGDLQLALHGCFPRGYALTGLLPGEVAKITPTFGVSWAQPVAQTWPNATAHTTSRPVANGGGEVQLQVYGTTTRRVVTCRSLAVNVTMGCVPIMGYDGPGGQYGQTIVGATRTRDDIIIDMIVDAEGADATPTYWDAWNTNAAYHLQVGLSTAAGTAMGLYFPRLIWTGKQPTQIDADGVNRIALQFRAVTDNLIATTDLTAAAMKIGFA